MVSYNHSVLYLSGLDLTSVQFPFLNVITCDLGRTNKSVPVFVAVCLGACAFGLVNVYEDAIEVRGPAVDDFLPAFERKGQPTGRPAARAVDGDATSGACESVTLKL